MMKKYASLLIFLIISFQSGKSQATNLTMTITPASSWTKDTMTFYCKIQNHSKKTFKVIPFSHDCNTKFYPLFWKIIILKDNTTFDFDPEESIMVLYGPAYTKLDKIVRHSEHNFSFCINFNKLRMTDSSESGFRQINIPADRIMANSKDSINKYFGEYRIQLEYTSRLKIKKQPDKLISTVTKVIYQDK